MTDAPAVVASYWAAAEERDWERFGALIAQDVVYEAPQTRERVRGREAYLRFNRDGFPGNWHLAVERIVGSEREAASWVRWTEPGDPGVQPGLCFFTVDAAGQVATIRDFWPQPYEPPAGRAHLTERY